jgi:hypothetical protein
MRSVPVTGTGSIAGHFARWQKKNCEFVTIRGGNPTVLVPPSWYGAAFS